jgi:anaerobic ribonucleoside-triphosphate reductase activating protein
MLIGRIYYPVTTLGPGKRLVIWTCGCTKKCKGCISPEWWNPAAENHVKFDIQELCDNIENAIHTYKPDGVTISGGDPLEQADELLYLLKKIHPLCKDILVYTGFTYAELQSVFTQDTLKRLTTNIAVLVDGRYIDELNDDKSPLRGSTNQEIKIFDQALRDTYTEYLKTAERKIQPVMIGTTLVQIGIPKKEYYK